MATSLATKRSKALDVRPCATEGCENTTRDSRVTVGEAPGTYRRERGGLCSPCYRDQVVAERTDFTVVKCTTDGCDQMTRPQAASAKHFPGTVKRLGNGRCQRCYRTPQARAEDDMKHRHNVAGLEAYMAARRARGIPACGRTYTWVLEDAA